ncbi:hypothetical protein EMCRGX_G015736 [Ephydatia muelleri]
MVLHKAILGLKQNMGSTDRTSFVYEKLLEDISKRWDPASLLLGMAAIANPRHKSLEWMKPVLYVIHCSLFIEMSGVIGLSHVNTDASSDELHEDNLDCDFFGDYDNDDDRAGKTGQADQGIIAALKVRYKSSLLARLVEMDEDISRLQSLAQQLPAGSAGLNKCSYGFGLTALARTFSLKELADQEDEVNQLRTEVSDLKKLLQTHTASRQTRQEQTSRPTPPQDKRGRSRQQTHTAQDKRGRSRQQTHTRRGERQQTPPPKTNEAGQAQTHTASRQTRQEQASRPTPPQDKRGRSRLAIRVLLVSAGTIIVLGRQPKSVSPHVLRQETSGPGTSGDRCLWPFTSYTGAKVSVIPASCSERCHPQDGLALRAANDSTIATFGTCSITLDLGLFRIFTWIFIIAAVKRPILGADFLKHYGLAVDVKCQKLLNSMTQCKVQGAPAPEPSLNLTLLPAKSDNVFEAQLQEFPSVPLYTRVPDVIPPERLAIARREFDHMLQLGIVRPSSKCPLGYGMQQQTFQRFSDEVLCGLHFTYAYIDDVLVASTSPEEHEHHLRCISDKAVGAVLQQCIGDAWHPIAYFSWKLKPAEVRYSAFDKELLAMCLAVKHFRHFVEGRVFHLLNDHKPLTFALASNSASYTPRQARHLDFISQFTSDVRHVKGEDALSRFTVDALVLKDIDGLDFHNVAYAQQSDPEIRQIMDGTMPRPSSAKLESIPLQSSDLTILCDVSTGVPRPLVPSALRRHVFDVLHSLAHPGIRATQRLIVARFIWLNIRIDVRNWAPHQNPAHWVDSLPLVLLSIRSTLKEDLKCSAAELVYGTTLRLPGEFFSAGSVSPCDPSAYVAQLKAAMQTLRATSPRQNQGHKLYRPSDLPSSTHVFVRHDAIQPPLQQPYDAIQPPLQQPYDAIQPPLQQPYDAIQPPLQQPYDAIQPPLQQPYDAIQPPLQQPYDAIQPPLQQPYDAIQPPLQQPYDAIQPPLQQPYDAIQRPLQQPYESAIQPPLQQQPYDAIQPPLQQPYDAIQPPLQQPYDAIQPPLQQPYDAIQPPLQQQPYDGPFKVSHRTDKHFTLDINGRKEVITIDRLKSAHVEETPHDPAILLPPHKPVPSAVTVTRHYFEEMLDQWLKWAPPNRKYPCTEDLVAALGR